MIELKQVRSISTVVNIFCFVTVLSAAACMNLLKIKAVERGFFCDDKSIRYPYRPETLTSDAVLLASFVPAWVLVFCLELTFGITASRRRAREYATSEDKGLREFLKSGLCNAAVLTVCLMYGNALCYIVSEITKACFGSLRPAFLAVCQPAEDVTSNCTGQFIQSVTCTNPNTKLVLDMRRSFVSGHASFSVFNMGFIILYLQHRLPTSSPWLLKSLVQTLALLFAVFVSATRVYDHYHHPQDIVGGVLEGIFFACLTMYKICPRFARCSPCQDEHETPLPTVIPSKPPSIRTPLKEKAATPSEH